MGLSGRRARAFIWYNFPAFMLNRITLQTKLMNLAHSDRDLSILK
jgi:hypothetical protein